MAATGMVNLLSSDGTTAQAQVGQFHESKGSTWMYIKAKGILLAYEWAIGISTDTGEFGQGSYAGTYPANGITSNVVIPQFAFADGEYGWAPCGPFNVTSWDDSTTFKVSALTLCVLNVPLYTSATAGSVDDTSASQAQIYGLRLHSTVGGSTAATACSATRKLTVGG